MGTGAGRTISVRMPEGTVEELRAATGQPFSSLVRYIMLAYLERLRIERRQREGANLRDSAAADLRELVNKDCDERGL
jgi:hypothetical protein